MHLCFLSTSAVILTFWIFTDIVSASHFDAWSFISTTFTYFLAKLDLIFFLHLILDTLTFLLLMLLTFS